MTSCSYTVFIATLVHPGSLRTSSPCRQHAPFSRRNPSLGCRHLTVKQSWCHPYPLAWSPQCWVELNSEPAHFLRTAVISPSSSNFFTFTQPLVTTSQQIALCGRFFIVLISQYVWWFGKSGLKKCSTDTCILIDLVCNQMPAVEMSVMPQCHSWNAIFNYASLHFNFSVNIIRHLNFTFD